MRILFWLETVSNPWDNLWKEDCTLEDRCWWTGFGETYRKDFCLALKKFHWTYLVYLNLSCIPEPILHNWTYPVYLNLSFIHEPILYTWTYPVYMNLSCISEPILYIWTYPVYLDLSCIPETIMFNWSYPVYLNLSW